MTSTDHRTAGSDSEPVALPKTTPGIDLSATVTVSGSARYELGRVSSEVNAADLLPAEREFLQLLLRDRAVLYDWGQHELFVPVQPFTFDRQSNQVVLRGGVNPDDETSWRQIGLDRLREILKPVFVGEWGPTSADTLARLERSGITVELIGCKDFGPEDPDAFMDALRGMLA